MDSDGSELAAHAGAAHFHFHDVAFDAHQLAVAAIGFEVGPKLVDGLGDDLIVALFGPRMVCTKCGTVGGEGPE